MNSAEVTTIGEAAAALHASNDDGFLAAWRQVPTLTRAVVAAVALGAVDAPTSINHLAKIGAFGRDNATMRSRAHDVELLAAAMPVIVQHLLRTSGGRPTVDLARELQASNETSAQRGREIEVLRAQLEALKEYTTGLHRSLKEEHVRNILEREEKIVDARPYMTLVPDPDSPST